MGISRKYYPSYLPPVSVTGSAAIFALSALSWNVFFSSRLFLMEQNVCRTYYKLHDPSKLLPDESVPEKLCKEAVIQAELVQLAGWLDTLWLIPGLFIGVPYGRLASIFGKRKILFINNVGYILSLVYGFVICWFHNFFNVKMLWLTCLFDLIGGGWVVDQSLLFTYFSDGLEANKMSKYFFNLSAFRMATRIVAMFIGSILLKVKNGAWILCIMGICLSFFILPALYLLPSDEPRHLRMASMPETAHMLLNNDRSSMESTLQRRVSFSSSRGSDSDDDDDEAGSDRIPDPSRFEIDDTDLKAADFAVPGESVTKTIVKAFTTDISLSFKTAADIFIHDELSRVCMLIFFTFNLATSVSIIFQQYAAKFFSWTLADANALRGFEMAVSLICLLIIPRLRTIVAKGLNLPVSVISDLNIMRASLIIGAVGVVFMGIASLRPFYVLALALYTIGYTGLPDSLRTFATMQMEKDGEDRVKRFYVGFALVENVGQLIGTPGFSWLYAVALTGHEGGWMTVSWPFWACGACLLVGVTFVYMLKRMSLPVIVGGAV